MDESQGWKKEVNSACTNCGAPVVRTASSQSGTESFKCTACNHTFVRTELYNQDQTELFDSKTAEIQSDWVQRLQNGGESPWGMDTSYNKNNMHGPKQGAIGSDEDFGAWENV